MKRLKICMALGLLLVSHTALACGPYHYSAADNRIYRFLPPTWKPKQEVSFATKNIMLWAKQTGCRDTAAIREAIYRGSLADWGWAIKNSGKPSKGFKQNAFVRHLRKRHDNDAIDLLYKSKEYECVRNQMRSPWYYNSRVSDEQQQMGELHRHTSEYKGKYLERQAFLGIKCAWAVGADSTVQALWNRHQGRLHSSIFRDEAEDYVARSLERMGRNREADAIYERLHRSQRDPDSEANIAALQEFLCQMDYWSAQTWYPDDHTERVVAELQHVRQVLKSPTLRHRAEYQYAAACMLDYLGRPAEGLVMLQGVQGGNAYMRKALRTLTFYLRSKVEPVSDDYVNYAVAEVQWLCGEMEREWRTLSDDDRQKIRMVNSWGCWHGLPTLNKVQSYAALRRTLLADSIGLCYRMAAAGHKIRALQMANVADNYLFRLTDNQPLKALRTTGRAYEVSYDDLNGEYCYGVVAKPSDTTMLKLRSRKIWGAHEYKENDHDYSNGLFCLADAMGASPLEEYRQRMLHPQDGVDRWMNARSYTGGDYWQDIIGTHYLRERNYHAAVSHLRHVSPQYQQRMNIYCQYDPFGIDCTTRNHDSTYYKLHFALRMDSLQRAMLHDPDPDRRSLAMLDYTIGLENSFDLCWVLTSYGHSYRETEYAYGYTDTWPAYGAGQVVQLTITHSPYAVKARAAVKQLRAKALKSLRTDDARARYHLRLGQYATVRQRYANTPTGQHLALVCDNAGQHRRK